LKLKVYFIQLLTCFVSIITAGQTNPCEGRGPAYSSLPGDTTITLKNGTTLTFNRCEFFDNRNCIEINEITDTSDLRRLGLTMLDRNGNVLLSCGMIEINMKKCAKECFDIPVKVRISVRFQTCNGITTTNQLPALYFNRGDGWRLQPKDSFIIIETSTGRFLEFETKCPLKINCDCRYNGTSLRFKSAKRKQSIREIILANNCPLFYNKENFYDISRKVKVSSMCKNTDSLTVQAKIMNEKGELIQLPPKLLSSLRHSKRKAGCFIERRRFFSRLFRPGLKSTGSFYRKYFIE
jgi:hypothetical protein